MQKQTILKGLFIVLIILLPAVSCDLNNEKNIGETVEMDYGSRAGNGGIPTCGYSRYTDLSALQGSLASLYYEDERLQERIVGVKSKLESLKNKVKITKVLTELIIEAETETDKAEKIIKILTPLPYIGGAAKVADTALKSIKFILDKAHDPAKRVKSILEKVENALEKVINALNTADNTLQSLKDYIMKADKLICLVDNCITGSAANSLAANIKSAVDIARDSIKTVNDLLDRADQYYTNAMNQLSFLTSAYEQNITNLLQAIKTLLKPLEDIYDSLNIQICAGPICMNLIDALSSVLGIFSDIISAILDPLLSELYKALDQLNIIDIPDFTDLLNLESLPTLEISINISIPFDFCKYYDIVRDCVPLEWRNTFCTTVYTLSVGGTSGIGTVYVTPESVVLIWTQSAVGYGQYSSCFKYWYVSSGSATIDNPNSSSTYVRNVTANTVIGVCY